MSNPNVQIDTPDNQLGLRAPADACLAIVATASTGDIALPQPFTRIEDVVAEHTDGPLVEAASYAIERYGLKVLLVRATGATPGAFVGSVTLTGTGTSVPTADVATVQPHDDYDVIIRIINGGTVGVTGITYQYSLDGGRTSYSGVISLGTANQIVIASAGVDINLGAGTLVAGDVITATTSAPVFDNAALDAALETLRTTAAKFTLIEVYGAMTSALLSTLDAKLEAMKTAGRPRRCVAHFRTPNAGESEATYLAAFNTALSASASRRVMLAAGRCKTDSSVGARPRFRRPPSLAVAPLACAVGEEVDIAELQYLLPGVYIRDANGNVDEHDEFINPGLDDSRALTLRTWEGRTGVYVNNPRLFSPVGSDYQYLQHGRCIDMACVIVREELEPLLSKGVAVIPDGTGRIAPEDAVAIEGQVNSRLAREMVGLKKVTRAFFALNRDEDVLRTGQIGYTTRIVPLAYIKKFRGSVALVASDKAAANVLG